MANEPLQKPSMSGLLKALWSFLWGLAWFQMLSGGDLAVVVVAIVLGVIFVLKHASNVVPYLIGVALAVAASLLVPGMGWPAEAIWAAVAGVWLI